MNVTATRVTTSVSPLCSFSSTVSTPESRTRSAVRVAWDTRTVSNGAHTLTARARDAAGNSTLSAPVPVNVANSSSFQNEILATGFDLPTSIAFLPDGRMLVVELPGTIKVLSPPYTSADPTPFLQLTNVGTTAAGCSRASTIALDPNFATNHYYYVFYTTERRTVTGCHVSPPRHPHRDERRQRGRPLPGSADRRHRAPRRRDRVRQ